MASKVKKRKARFELMEQPTKKNDDDEKLNDEDKPNPFGHKHVKTNHALQHAQLVEKGKKFWEEKEDYERLSELEWWQLKAAKDFETGVGQKFYRHGTLSTWTEEQIAALQKDMEDTLSIAGYDKSKHKKVRVKTLKTNILPPQKADININDFAAEIKKQKQNQTKNKKKEQEKHKEKEEKDPLYEFDDEIIHTGDSDDEDDDGKQDKYNGQSMSMDPSQFKVLTSPDQLAGKFDEAKMNKQSHRRTRTEALRFKLQNISKQLDDMQTVNRRQSNTMEQHKQIEQQRDMKLQQELSAMKGALTSANDELDRAEEQLTEKDEEIANLQRTLQISKQMNTELAQTALDSTGKGTKSGLTADDLLKQRVKDANRFAFMLSAMQEQLDFERTQFVKRIHTLELQLEHKDVQLNALYQLYNKLVAQTKQKTWWEKWTSKK